MSEPAASPTGPVAPGSAIHRFVAASLRQRFLVGLLTALIAGVVLSMLLGGGLMALAFYSSHHGYDDDANRFR